MATQKLPTMVDENLIRALYGVVGTQPPADRGVIKVIVVMEPGKPVLIDETTIILTEVEAPVAPKPADSQAAEPTPAAQA